MLSTCLNYLLIAKHITLHLPHENPVSNPAVFLTNIDWESSLCSLQSNWGLSSYRVGVRVGGYCRGPKNQARPQLKGKHTGQLGMAETPFPTRVEGLTLDLRVLIPCVSFLPRLSHQGVFEIGGAEGAKRETRPQGLLC